MFALSASEVCALAVGEMSDTVAGAGKIQCNLRTCFVPESKEVLKELWRHIQTITGEN